MKTSIYLFNTQDGSAVEHYDCLYIGSLPYCRRPRDPIDLTRTNEHFSCNERNNGKRHRFSNLRSNNVSISTILHQWKSSLEQAEAFGRYLRDRNEPDGDLCQCEREGGFGKFCEYQLLMATTPEETLMSQVRARDAHPNEMQRLGHITCYEGIRCDSGVLCLDWREICDGTQNCMLGLDEENCDILEMNTCEDEEYRCSNGMCIPQQYFLDGERDCLDGTDEMRHWTDGDCSEKRVSVECDDHICLPSQWSCGDGQCIWNRLVFRTEKYTLACSSRRDRYFMCEMHYRNPMWTMTNGRCHGAQDYVEDLPSNRTEEEECECLLKCLLSKRNEETCPCKRGSVGYLARLQETCPNQTIQYPKGAFMAPFLFFFFNTTRHPQDFSPTYILINGTVKCRQSLVTVTRRIDSIQYSGINGFTESELCNGTHSLESFEWNPSSDQCFRANESTDACGGWNPCLSITRIKDGLRDCWNGRDEKEQTKENIEKSCSRVQRHRFNCSIDQPTCLSVTALADDWNHCANEYDEVWQGTTQRLVGMKCSRNEKDDCSRLRQYIEQSWLPPRKSDTPEVVRMSFRSYCDTLWDLESREDENRVQCQHWWKCTPDQYRCETGQCVDENWLNDGEWDCMDALDERELFTAMMRRVREQARIIQSNDEVTLALDTCHSSSFVCLSPHSRQRQLLCLDRSQLGDQKIDCLGAIDERNTLQHCLGASMLGHSFLCPSTHSCVPWLTHCRENNRCPNRTDDHHWCSRSTTTSTCTGVEDFICFNGRCLRGSRCNRNFQCPFGEDEFMCDYASVQTGLVLSYRFEKELETKREIQSVDLPVFPSHLNTVRSNRKEISLLRSAAPIRSDLSSSLTLYRCNRGLGILFDNHSVVCFCPPQYYGDFCEYHADRLLILLHLNLTQSIYTSQTDPTIVIKLLVLFLFDDRVLRTNEFHIRPAWEISTFIKKMIHFPYSRSTRFRQHRQDRYFNRTEIIHFHPYSIRIEAFEMDVNERLSLIGVWQYPIIFDYLPAFRFAKVLHLTNVSLLCCCEFRLFQ